MKSQRPQNETQADEELQDDGGMFEASFELALGGSANPEAAAHLPAENEAQAGLEAAPALIDEDTQFAQAEVGDYLGFRDLRDGDDGAQDSYGMTLYASPEGAEEAAQREELLRQRALEIGYLKQKGEHDEVLDQILRAPAKEYIASSLPLSKPASQPGALSAQPERFTVWLRNIDLSLWDADVAGSEPALAAPLNAIRSIGAQAVSSARARSAYERHSIGSSMEREILTTAA